MVNLYNKVLYTIQPVKAAVERNQLQLKSKSNLLCKKSNKEYYKCTMQQKLSKNKNQTNQIHTRELFQKADKRTVSSPARSQVKLDFLSRGLTCDLSKSRLIGHNKMMCLIRSFHVEKVTREMHCFRFSQMLCKHKTY